MKQVYLKGVKTETVTAAFDKKDIWSHVKETIESVSKFPGHYVNHRGNWEIDHGGHGSGYQEELRPPTPEETSILKALELLESIYLKEVK